MENVYILNGGLLKWKKENLALEQGAPKENSGPVNIIFSLLLLLYSILTN